jgi:hypothetical protein
MKALRRVGLFLAFILGIGVPAHATGQDESPAFGLSGELGVGLALKGGGLGSFGGKAAARVHVGSGEWAVGVRAMGGDGERRRESPCFLWCEPIETYTETAALLYRIVPLSEGGSAVYVGAGVGHLSGRRFIGSSTELEDLSETGLSLEAALHSPRGGARVVLAVQGYVGSGGPLAVATIGLGLGR